jgi:hypothetical protein
MQLPHYTQQLPPRHPTPLSFTVSLEVLLYFWNTVGPFWRFITVHTTCEETHFAYGIQNTHKVGINFKSTTISPTTVNQMCDPQLMHSNTNSLESRNLNLLRSKQIILLWARQYLHCTKLQNMAESKSVSSTTFSLVRLRLHLHQQKTILSCIHYK